MRPLIGISCSFESVAGVEPRERMFLNAAYCDAVYAAGGTPFPIAPPAAAEPALIDELLRRVDGLLFTGGPDLDPRHYGQQRHAQTQVLHPRRDAFDIALFRAADAADLPLLSICLGCQIASVSRAGCLVQHVDDRPAERRVEHYDRAGGSRYHEVDIAPDSRLARIVGRTRLRVNSRHHQIIDERQIGTRLRAVAHAADGAIEAAEDAQRSFLLAVQWHPEDMLDQREHLALFEALTRAAADRRL